MKYLILSFFLTLASESLAQTPAKVQFTYFGNSIGQQSFYACSYAESITSDYIRKFGGTDAEIYCSGGITQWSMQPVSISASFSVPAVTGSGSNIIELRGDSFNPACGLNVRTIRELLKVFKNVEVLQKSDACAFASSNFYYQLKVNR